MLLVRMKRVGASRLLHTSQALYVRSSAAKDCDTDFNGELDMKEFRKVLRTSWAWAAVLLRGVTESLCRTGPMTEKLKFLEVGAVEAENLLLEELAWREAPRFSGAVRHKFIQVRDDGCGQEAVPAFAVSA